MLMKNLAALTLTAAVATGAFAQEQGRVLSSVPITQQVAVPQQVCNDQQVPVPPRPSGAGAVVGAIAGGLIGNAIGGGGGRAAATGAGLIGGAMLGNQVESSGPVQYQNVRQCSTQTFYQNRTVGYNVTYEYNGRNYTTQTSEPPGKWIPLSVQPLVNDPVYSNDGYYSTQTPPQGAYSTSYPQTYDNGYYAPPPIAPTYSAGATYSPTDYVAPLLLGAAIGAGAYYATRPNHHYRPGYRPGPGPGWNGGPGRPGWRH